MRNTNSEIGYYGPIRPEGNDNHLIINQKRIKQINRKEALSVWYVTKSYLRQPFNCNKKTAAQVEEDSERTLYIVMMGKTTHDSLR